jgi:two-component system sensor histidine kinase KdpD
MTSEQQEREQRASRFLSLLQESRCGKFKIYLGMAPGVGKTYRMLTEARQLLSKGYDVRIGLIETHNRTDTVDAMQGIPEVVRKKIFYKGKYLEELNVEALLILRPNIVLVDELAHTNVPGSKNEKRWQDVFELLDAGINVISALNIQHIESINAEVERITQINITERVPDFVIRRADEIVNVDLTVDDLIDRLQSGKIYDLNKVQHALLNFFQFDKLLQLRELALREVAHQLERKIEAEIVAPEERSVMNYTLLLACISTHEKLGREIIRKSARWATFYGLKWRVIHIETPNEHPDKIDLALQRGLINNYKLATDLGAEVVRIQSSSISKGLIEYITAHKINLIVMGKSLRSRWAFWQDDPIRQILKKVEKTDLIILS